MGTGRGQVLRVFLIQGGVMGLAGSLLGAALARAFLVLWDTLAVEPDGTPMFIVEMPLSLFLLSASGATLIGILSAVAPARRAARLDPVVAIRS
jgi:lipoprotein-releasing system permease protein